MATITAAAGGGNWTTGATWTGGVVPTAADDVKLAATSGAVTINAAAVCRSLDCTGYTSTLTHAASITLSIGDGTAGTGNKALTLVSGMTYTVSGASTSDISFISTSTTQQTITTGTKLVGNININGTGSSYILGDNLSVAATNVRLTVTDGTFSANNFNMSLGDFATAGNNAILTLGSGTHTLQATGSVVQTISGTLNADTSTIKIVDTSNSTITIRGGTNKIFNNIWFNRGASTGSITFEYSNTYADIKDTGTAAHSLLFTAGTTQTITTFTVSGGSTGARITIDSAAASTATHALTKLGGGQISSNFLNIQHSIVTPGGTWYAGTGSVDNQATITAGSGWIFTAPTTPGTATASFLLLTI